MCEHCGCRGVEPLAELMDEHFVLLDLAGDVRRHLGEGDNAEAIPGLRRLSELLDRHVRRGRSAVCSRRSSSRASSSKLWKNPVAVVTLGADEWETVSTAQAEEPSFLRTG